MVTSDPRVDAYIERAASFAQPILRQLRAVLHRQCPELIETIKWSSPFFDYHGHPLCHVAAFKQHCSFGFWKSAALQAGTERASEGRGDFGRLTSVAELPDESELSKLIQAAMQLIDSGSGALQRDTSRAPKAELPMPPELQQLLAGDAAAQANFAAFSPSQRREYIEWISEAKRAETREKRLAQTLLQVGEGKVLNWKYQR